MRTAAVVNLKGGVGKSTTAINMALIMSQVHGKKVLLIDNDFQAAVTKFFEKHSYDALSMEEVLRNPILFAQDVIVPSGRWGLDIIPSNMNLVAAADDLITDKDGDQMGRIRHVLNQVEEDYDYCIIDCHPGVGIEVLNALAAAEDIIIPIKADKNALDGMEELDDIIQEIRPYNEKLESVRCLVTMYTKDIDVIKGEEALRNSKYDVFNTHIRHIKYDIENYGSLVPIANDLQEDEAVNIVQEVIKPDFAEAGVNTENDEIMQIVEANAVDKSTGAKDWRDVKKIIDGVLPTLRGRVVVITNLSGSVYLKSQEDKNGRNLDLVKEVNGKEYFQGKELITLSDEDITASTTEKMIFYVVNLYALVKFFERKGYTVSTDKSVFFESDELALKVQERFDCEKLDDRADFKIEFAAA